MADQNSKDILPVVGHIVGGYVSNHTVDLDDIPDIVKKVFYAVHDVAKYTRIIRQDGPLVPAVPIDESVQDDCLICLEDGKKLKVLTRHLKKFNMTIDDYRERWGLPSDYPAVAPNYARRRSSIAKNTGLGMTGRSKRQKTMALKKSMKQAIG